MIRKISAKTKLIVILVSLIIITATLPIKEMFLYPSITGMAIAKVYIRGAQTNYSCSTIILGGWNLISIPCLAANTSVDSVLSSISNNYTSIFGYNKSDNIDPWKTYNPNLPSWVIKDLITIDEKQGYWIDMKNQSTLSLDGILMSPDKMHLTSGWNLIGYPSTNSKDIASALISISGEYTIVWVYNASDDKYYYYNASELNGSFDKMMPYYGYWINMSNDNDLYVT